MQQQRAHKEVRDAREQQRSEGKSKGEQLLEVGRKAASEEASSSMSVVDRRIAPAQKRKHAHKSSLAFFTGGEVQSSVQEDRRRLGVESWEEAEAGTSESASVSGAPAVAKRVTERPPDVEWWDLNLLPNDSYDDIADNDTASESKLNERKFTHYVEHPVQLDPAGEKPPPEPQPLKLTKREQRKLRKQRREARERERQDLIRQGLMEPPKPKVKISNLARVMGADNSADPTSIEQEVRKQEQERAQAHQDRNEARKLTPAERAEKKERQMFNDDPVDTHVAVYRVERLNDPRHRFKVEANARQNKLTGIAIHTEAFAIVIVEGCSKSQERFRKLMQRRIDWNSESTSSATKAAAAHDTSNKGRNQCTRVWKGSLGQRAFPRFSLHDMQPKAARKVLEDEGVAHYWDVVAEYRDYKSNT